MSPSAQAAREHRAVSSPRGARTRCRCAARPRTYGAATRGSWAERASAAPPSSADERSKPCSTAPGGIPRRAAILALRRQRLQATGRPPPAGGTVRRTAPDTRPSIPAAERAELAEEAAGELGGVHHHVAADVRRARIHQPGVRWIAEPRRACALAARTSMNSKRWDRGSGETLRIVGLPSETMHTLRRVGGAGAMPRSPALERRRPSRAPRRSLAKNPTHRRNLQPWSPRKRDQLRVVLGVQPMCHERHRFPCTGTFGARSAILPSSGNAPARSSMDAGFYARTAC